MVKVIPYSELACHALCSDWWLSKVWWTGLLNSVWFVICIECVSLSNFVFVFIKLLFFPGLILTISNDSINRTTKLDIETLFTL